MLLGKITRTALCAVLTGVCVASVAAPAVPTAEEVAACWKKADGESARGMCLNLEHRLLEDEYDNVIERVMNEARGIDRLQKKKTAVSSFTQANKAFDAYVKEECDWAGDYADNSQVATACRINLTRVRMANLIARYLENAGK